MCNTPRFLNIINCYKNTDEIEEYINELNKQTLNKYIHLCIVMNDENGSEMIEGIKRKSTVPIDVFYPRNNLGYLNGLLFGYCKFVELYKSVPEWVVFSNTDIEYENNNFFDSFLDMRYEKDVWCICPDIYVPKTGIHQNPACKKRRSRKKIEAYISIYSNPIAGKLYFSLGKIKRKIKKKRVAESSQYIYQPHGAYMILRREMLEKIKNDRYGCLMYNEEIYFAEQILANEKRVYYDEKLKIIHNEHSSTSSININEKCRMFEKSLRWNLNRFY